MQVTRVLPNAMAEDKRISLTCSLDGSIEDIEPHESQLFGWPASEMKARHIADVSLDTQKLNKFWLKCFLATFSACLIACVQHHTCSLPTILAQCDGCVYHPALCSKLPCRWWMRLRFGGRKWQTNTTMVALTV